MHHTAETLNPGRYAVMNGNTYTSQVWNVTAECVTVHTAPSGVYPSVLLGTISHAEALGVLARVASRVLAFRAAPLRQIGKAAACELHKELGRLKFREQLPTLAEVRPPTPREDWPRYYAHHPDGTRQEVSAMPGLDLLTLELPDGSAVLLPLGYRGRLELKKVSGYAAHIPAHLRQTFRGLYFVPNKAIPAELLERGEVLA